MNNNDLTLFEKYVIESNNCEFNHSFELVMFVEKLNEYVVKYYNDSIYSYILRSDIERRNGKEIQADEFYKIINDRSGRLLIFPNCKDYDNDDEYLNYIFNNLLSFAEKVGFTDLKYACVMQMAQEKRLASIVRYSECVKCANELNKLQDKNIYKYVSEIENAMQKENFGFLYLLHDFINRLGNYYLILNNDQKIEKLKSLKREIKPLD